MPPAGDRYVPPVRGGHRIVRFAFVGAVEGHSHPAAPSLVSVTSELRKGDPNIRNDVGVFLKTAGSRK